MSRLKGRIRCPFDTGEGGLVRLKWGSIFSRNFADHVDRLAARNFQGYRNPENIAVAKHYFAERTSRDKYGDKI